MKADRESTAQEYDIVVSNLTKSFGPTIALNDVSFTVNNREFFAIIGPSGCGKTTLLKCLVGLERPGSGSIVVGGRNITDAPVHKRNIGLIFQNFALLPHLNVFENIAFGLEIQKLLRSQIKESVEEVMNVVGLEGLGNRKPNEISVGQQQRVAIARSIVTKPKVLLFDEPLGNLDYDLQKRMLVEIKQLHRKIGLTSIFVTHNQEHAMTLADRIMVMNLGRIEQIGTSGEVYTMPSSIFVARFVGEINMLRGEVSDAGRDFVTVETEIGKFTSSARKGVSKGQRLAYSIRPENVLVGEKARNCGNRTTGVVQDRVYKGTGSDVLVKLGGSIVFRGSQGAEDSSQLPIQVGEPAMVGWRAEDALLLDKSSVVEKIDVDRAILGA